MTQHTPTSEQQEARKLFATRQSLAIEAGAGAGKTSTLMLLAQDASETNRRGQYIAFNKAIVTEAGTKMPGNVACSTAHSLAYRNIVGQNPWMADRLRSSRRMKSSEIAARLDIEPIQLTLQDNTKKRLSPGYLAGLAMRGITRFCQSADATPDSSHVPYIDGIDMHGSFANNNAVSRAMAPALVKAWADLTSADGQLPFKHDHYLKLWQLSKPRINADFILFDEAQDANPVLLDIVKQQSHAQLVWVGDSQQQIYSFTGAINALAQVGAEHRAFLTRSFRFGPAVADIANDVLSMLDAELRLTGTESISSVVEPTEKPSVILCRTNARAVRHLMDALKAGLRPHIVGGGREVVDFAKAARDLQTKNFTAHPELACFESWGEVQSYVQEDEQGGDLRLMVKLVDEFTADVIIDALENMPSEQTADVIISTAHKSKGREWDSVQIADDFPAEPKGEELRLLYVAVTRAKLQLDITNVKLLSGEFEEHAATGNDICDHGFFRAICGRCRLAESGNADRLVGEALPVASVEDEAAPEADAPTLASDDNGTAPVAPEVSPGKLYRAAVEWIALNDEPGANLDETESLVSVSLIADVHGKHPHTVAVDVMTVRQHYPYHNAGRGDRNGDWECSCGRKIHGNAAAASHMKAHQRRKQNHRWVEQGD